MHTKMIHVPGNRARQRVAVWLLGFVTALQAGVCAAAVVSPNVTEMSGSQPHLNAAADAWVPFSTAQGVPSAGKLIGVRYIPVPFDSSVFPLDSTSATVTLRPSTSGSVISCTYSATEPVLTDTNAGQCFHRTAPGSGDMIEIYYLGLLAAGDDIRYTIDGLDPAVGVHTIEPFDSDAVLSGTPPSPTLSRDPARLVLVLDKSGSMGWSSNPEKAGCEVHADPPPGCEPARWEILDSAVTQALAVGTAYALPGDQFGVTLFDSTVTAANTFDLTNLNGTTAGAFLAELATRDPGGNTSIGAGVTTLEPDLTGPDAGDYNQVMLLFTDGDQNTAPYLVSDDPGDPGAQVKINPTSNSPVGAGIKEFAPGVLDLCPFALRADNPNGLLGTTYLQDIADLRCDGTMNVTMSVDPGEPDLVQFFLDVLSDAIIGDKLELSAVHSGHAQLDSTGAPPVVEETFIVSREDIAFTAHLGWAQAGNAIQSPILSKDGVDFPLGHTTHAPIGHIVSGRDFFSATLRRPYCNAGGQCVNGEGQWTLRFRPVFEVAKRFDYHLFVLNDNASLASAFRAAQTSPGVRQPLTLTAELSEGGSPLTGLPAGSVTAWVKRPQRSLGTVLSERQVQPVAATDTDPISAAGRKATAMLADAASRPAILSAVEPSLEQVVELAETAPGTYAADYTDTQVEGVYQVDFFVEADTAANGAFTRTQKTSRYVRVQPDPEATAETAQIDQTTDDCDFPGGCYDILIRPIDGFDNLLGPGKGGLMYPGGTAQLRGPVHDNLDGSFTFRIGLPDPTPDGITLEVAGVPVTIDVPSTGPWDWLEQYALWLLLLLIVLALLIWLVRR